MTRRPVGDRIVVLLVVLIAVCACGPSRGLVRGARVLIGASGKAEAAAIWGEREVENAAYLRGLLNVTERAAVEQGVTVFKAPAGQPVADAIVELLATQKDGVVTVVGHNVDGGLRLPDGSQLALKTLASRTAGAKLLAISCYSKAYVKGTAAGIPSSIAFDVAQEAEVAFWAGAAQKLDPDASIADIEAAFKSTLASVVLQRRLKTTIKVAALPGAPAGALIVWEELAD